MVKFSLPRNQPQASTAQRGVGRADPSHKVRKDGWQIKPKPIPECDDKPFPTANAHSYSLTLAGNHTPGPGHDWQHQHEGVLEAGGDPLTYQKPLCAAGSCCSPKLHPAASDADVWRCCQARHENPPPPGRILADARGCPGYGNQHMQQPQCPSKNGQNVPHWEKTTRVKGGAKA